jgi:F-type H+-transporting ATPase subunit epsilon
MKSLTLSVFTPERVIAENKEVSFVALPAYEGEMGVLPGHAKIMVQLTSGTVRYESAGGTEKIEIMGGFAEVLNDAVEVFVEEAALRGQLDTEGARQEKAKAKKSLFAADADIDIEMAEIKIKKELLEIKKKSRGF